MNNLFPIFIKLDQIETLLIGGGPVGLEKCQALLANNRNLRLSLVAEEICTDLERLLQENPHINVYRRKFESSDLEGKHLVFTATNNPEFNLQLQELAYQRQLLVNAADKPTLCHFYLGSIVQKGNLKIAISTNGKSPTIAKRVKEFLQDIIPEELDETLFLMEQLRNQISGDFKEKVKVLNEHTKELINK